MNVAVIILGVAFVIAVVTAGVLANDIRDYRKRVEKVKAARDAFERDALVARARNSEVSSALASIAKEDRYEIMFSDWVEEEGDHWVGNPMRIRWVIFDANRYIYPLASNAETEWPSQLQPLMLGNAPTRAEAEAQALAWVLQVSPRGSVVL